MDDSILDKLQEILTKEAYKQELSQLPTPLKTPEVNEGYNTSPCLITLFGLDYSTASKMPELRHCDMEEKIPVSNVELNNRPLLADTYDDDESHDLNIAEETVNEQQIAISIGGYLWQHGMWEVKHLAMTRIWRNGCMHQLQQTFTFWVSRNCPSTGNILGAENNGAAAKWPNLIHGTLNNSGTCKNINQCDCLSSRSDKTADIPEAVYGLDSDLECSRVRKSSFFSSRRSFLDLNILSKPDCEAKYDPKKLEQKCGLADHLFQGKSIHRVDCSSSFMSVSSDDKYGLSEGESHSTMLSSPFSDKSDSSRMSNKFNSTKEKYYLEASKRMVGIFLCIGHVAI